MPATKKTGTPRNQVEANASATGTEMMFDYRAAAKAARISAATLRSIERQAEREFPRDPMLKELHILRAVKTRSSGKTPKGKV